MTMAKISQWTLAFIIFMAIALSVLVANAQTQNDDLEDMILPDPIVVPHEAELFGGHITESIARKSEIDIISEQAERLALQEILLSKYAQKMDSLRFSCK